MPDRSASQSELVGGTLESRSRRHEGLGRRFVPLENKPPSLKGPGAAVGAFERAVGIDYDNAGPVLVPGMIHTDYLFCCR